MDKELSLPWRILLGAVGFAAIIGWYAHLSKVKHEENPKNRSVPNWTQLKEGFDRCFSVSEFSKTGNPQIVDDGKASLSVLTTALGYSIVISVFVGMMVGNIRVVRYVILPVTQFTSKLAVTALIAIIFAAVGRGNDMLIAVIMIGTIPGIIIAIDLAVRDIPEDLKDKAYTLGTGPLQLIWRRTLPLVLPKILDAIRIATGLAVAWLIAAESISPGDSGFGFGYQIYKWGRQLNVSAIIFYILTLGAFAYTVDESIKILQRVLCPWYNITTPGIFRRSWLALRKQMSRLINKEVSA